MAMSKENYIVEGRKLYVKGGLRPVGDSWQTKAIQIGFDDASLTGKPDEKPQSLGDLVHEKIQPRNVVDIHISRLMLEACHVDTTVERAQRLMNKVNKLRAKWEKRGVVHTFG